MRLDGWRPLKTDPCSDRSRGKGFGEEGMADHLFIRYQDPYIGNNSAGPYTFFRENQDVRRTFAEVLWVEFKRPGTKATAHQLTWHSVERIRGAYTVIAGRNFEPTFDGFVDWYRKSGLLRRAGL